MSGDHVVLSPDPAGRIVEYVRTLARLPAEPSWVLVGGLAVNVRVRRVHRATNDIDTVSHDQLRLVEILASGDADRLSAAKVQLRDPAVEVDVMDSTEGAPLPTKPSDRAFALARRWTMATASPVGLRVVGGHELLAEAAPKVASVPALVALKCVSIPRRQAGGFPQKIGSDIQDLYRLVEGSGFDVVVCGFQDAYEELRVWVANELRRDFTGRDLRYFAARLHNFADNVDARSITEADLSALGELGAALA